MTIEDGDPAGPQPAEASEWWSSPAHASGTRPFHIKAVRDGDRILIRLSGELDDGTRHPFDRIVSMLTRERALEVVLDLRRLSFISTGGQRELLLLWRRSRAEGYDFRLIGLSDYLRESFRTTGVDKLLQLT